MLDKLIAAALQGLGTGGGSNAMGGAGGNAMGGAGGSPMMNIILQLLMSQMGGQQQAPQGGAGGLGGLLSQVLGGAGGPGGRQTGAANDPLGGLLGGMMGGGGGGGAGRAPTSAQGGSLEDLVGAILGGQQQQQGAGMGGGLNGLLSQLQSAGLGREADSWVSSGQNLPVEPTRLVNAFGEERLNNLAQTNGMDLNEMLAGLSQQLPQVVDQLTPKGRMPQSNELQDLLGSLLGGGTRSA